MTRNLVRMAVLILAIVFALIPVRAADALRLAVTTSFENSGLAGVLLPVFRQETGIDVSVIIVGTGQALRLGRNGDVDAVLVHSRAAELAFLAKGYASRRCEIMYNDFVIVGPRDDPARVRGLKHIAAVMNRLAAGNGIFISRGDDSGTHKKELEIWKSVRIDLKSERGAWYRAVGAGMGTTLNIASAADAYAMSDRATWLKFNNKGNLTILFEGDPILRNQYGLMIMNAKRHPHTKAEAAAALMDWVTSKPAQALIGSYRAGGELLFTPNFDAKTSCQKAGP